MPQVFYNPLFGQTVAAGDKLYFYESGTATELDVYTDLALTTPHTQPIVADANGVFAAVYIDPSLGNYKITLDDTSDVEKFTQDELPVSDLAQALIDIDAAEAAIVVLQGQVTALEASVDTLETESADYETRITALEASDASFSSPLISTQKSTSQSPSFSVTTPAAGTYHVECDLNLYSVNRTVTGQETFTLKVGATVIDTVIVEKDGDTSSAHRDFAYVGFHTGGTYTEGTAGARTITITQSGTDVFNINQCYLKVTRLT